MAQIQDSIDSVLEPAGGMNQDDSRVNKSPDSEISRFQTGDYRYALNARIGSSTEANVGALENIASTLAVTNYSVWNGVTFIGGGPPAGTNIALGRLEDIVEGRIYWPVYNSNGEHLILCWVKTQQRIYELLRWSGLNFDSQSKVSLSKINKFLFFVDGLETYSNPPRMFNVETIYSLKFDLGSNFSEYHISFAKWPPLAPPFVISYGNSNQGYQLNKGLFQFAYRYIYVNGFKSTWSPPSIFVSIENAAYLTDDAIRLVVPGFIENYETGSYFQHDSIKFYEVVQYIEYGYRQSTLDTWKLFKRYTVAQSASIDNKYADFTNIGPQATIAQADIGQYFDSIPFFSKACEAIDNRPMLGNNIDDLQIADFSVTDVEVYSDTGGSDSWVGPTIDNSIFTSLSADDCGVLSMWRHLSRYTFKEGGIYKLGIVFQHYAGRTSLVQTTDGWTYSIPRLNAPPAGTGSEYFHALGFKIPGSVNPPDWAVGYQIVRSNCLNIEFFLNGIVNDFVLLKADVPVTTDQQITPQQAQDIINQYHNNALLGTQLNSLLGSQIEITDQFGGDYPLGRRLANYYRKSISAANLAAADQIYMDISNWTNASYGAHQLPSNNLFYNFQSGDRVRFKGNPSLGTTVVFDVEIVDSTGKGIIINVPAGLTSLQTRANPGTTTERDFSIEIYRPKPYNKQAEVIFYEMGEWYPITNARTVSRDFEKRDFTWDGGALVTATAGTQEGSPFDIGFYFFNKWPIINGDTHYVNKAFYYQPAGSFTSGVTTLQFMSMNQNKNNAGGFWEHNDGRPLVAYQYPPVQLTKSTQVRFGGKFLEDSIFIAINTFLDANQYIYPSEYGPIRALVSTSNTQVESVGNILLAIGEDTSWSIYVNRVTIDDLSGRTQVGLSDKVLGSYNTLLGGHGTLNGESVSKNNGRVIWWNAKKGTWVRYSRDGLTAISQIYNMKNWFNDLAALIINEYGTAENPKAISVQDNYHETWLTAINHSSLPSTFKGYSSYKCAEFHESQDQWKTIFDYLPDVFARLDNDVYSIIGCTVHIHEEGADFGSFYGVKKDSAIEFISNQQPRQNKVWEYLNLQATDKWSAPSIKGDYKSNGATMQETEILLANWDTREDLYVKDILRDQNSVNVSNPIIEGNPMRGRSLDIYLQLDPDVTWLSVFNYLIVGYIMSEKNVKK